MKKKVFAVVAADGFIRVVGYFLLPIYLGLMSQSNFGEFSFYFAAMNFLVPIVTLGLYIPQLSKFTNEESHLKKREIFSTTLVAVLISQFIFYSFISLFGVGQRLFLFVFGDIEAYDLKYYAFLSCLYISAINMILYTYAICLKDAFSLIIFNIIRFFGTSIASILFLMFGSLNHDASLLRLLGIATGEAVATILFSYMYVSKYFTFSINFLYLKGALQTGLSVTPAAIWYLVCGISDRYFISRYQGSDELAIFSLAMLLVAPVQMIAAGVQAVWSPNLFEIKDKLIAFSITLKHSIAIFFSMMIVVGGILLLSYMGFVFTLFPIIYEPILYIIPLLGIGTAFSSLAPLAHNVLVLYQLSHYVSIFTFVTLIITLLTGYFFIIPYGYMAAAISMPLIQAFNFVLLWCFLSGAQKVKAL